MKHEYELIFEVNEKEYITVMNHIYDLFMDGYKRRQYVWEIYDN